MKRFSSCHTKFEMLTCAFTTLTQSVKSSQMFLYIRAHFKTRGCILNRSQKSTYPDQPNILNQRSEVFYWHTFIG